MASKSSAAHNNAEDDADVGGSGSEYRYQQEIAQMMFVFGDVVDPHPDVTKLVEDIVRNQVIEMIIQSRRLAQRRGSRFLAPEDLIFLIRYDRAKVNRLRNYLSWKDVRKNAKDSGDGAAAGGGGAADVDVLEDPGAMDNPVKSHKMKLRLPWDISNIYSEHLRSNANGEDEEEDEDDIEAHEDSIQRLKDADEATRRMTREEYVHYSECRQASFTFRKSKRFREFINAGAYLDVKPNDDIIDILGFLAFEVVRELCVSAVAIKKSLEEQEDSLERKERGDWNSETVESTSKEEEDCDTSVETVKCTDTDSTNSGNGESKKRKIEEGLDAVVVTDSDRSPSKRNKLESSGSDEKRGTSRGQGANKKEDGQLCGLFSLPPSVGKPLKPAHIQEAFARLQRGRASLTSGMRGSGGPGGLRRTRVVVI
ncbi:TFIID-18kDa-domain-containing protein [Violaceomyces palustris]|uniref:TFIID-18kDa-domain-containing protein n=1 Tax=Violaceomyces palustris TaxID=1673888 RepID=A0ACD0NW19_9BASI|nr:TFIID-18kDa-domain-containing protein [Violaceomyces palustris]